MWSCEVSADSAALGCHGDIARLGYADKRIGLEFGIALAYLDEIGDQVVTLFHVDVHGGERLLHVALERYQAVFRRYVPKGINDDSNKNYAADYDTDDRARR